ncbi:MAG TPA: hypothetical protein VM492_03390 [Sumerlaeia bacterium]|nr:hypothetical protein [Sumerlaeia bacterium]
MNGGEKQEIVIRLVESVIPRHSDEIGDVFLREAEFEVIGPVGDLTAIAVAEKLVEGRRVSGGGAP